MTLAEGLRNNPWIPYRPHPVTGISGPSDKQVEFLLLPTREALFGGAAGGGKSDGLLMGALQFVEQPGFSALLLRRTFTDLDKPGSLMDRAYQWLKGTAANWNANKHQWRFPSGAVVSFGYLERDAHLASYDSSEYQWIGFDELCQFEEYQYVYMHGRLRRLEGVNIPIRLRAGTNPGGRGHRWIMDRFAIEGRPGKPFVQALLTDNPFLDQAEYAASLDELPDILKQQRKYGKWVSATGDKPFDPVWWEGKNRYDLPGKTWKNACVARYHSWDTAMKDGEEHAFTAMTSWELGPDNRVALAGAWKGHIRGVDVADHVLEHAIEGNHDGKLKAIIIEDASSGPVAIQALRSRFDWVSDLVFAFNPGKFGDKMDRAMMASTWCKRGCVLLPHPCEEAPWLFDYERDLEDCPDITHWDTIDSADQAIIYLRHMLAEGWRGRAMPE